MQILSLWVFISMLMVLAMQPDALRGSPILIGWEAPPNKYPFIALLQVAISENGDEKFCGGSILNKNHILTAGHCIYGPASSMTITVGEHNPWSCRYYPRCQQLKVEKVIRHPGYDILDQGNTINDVAILVLKGDIKFDADSNKKIAPITEFSQDAAQYDGKIATFIGWGGTLQSNTSPMLKEIRPTIMSSNSGCGGGVTFGDPMTRVCGFTNGGSPHSGDSGGPLFIMENGKYTLIGVSSYTYAHAPRTKPAVFANVAYYYKWIKDNS